MIFSIAMGADYSFELFSMETYVLGAEYSFYVKSIATYAPTFLGYNNSVVAIVKSLLS